MCDNKTYHIDSWEKLLNVVNSENRDRLFVDLLSFLLYYENSITKIRNGMPEETKDIVNTDIAKAVFEWTDDGIEGLKSVSITDPSTGEVTTRKFEE